MRVTATRTATGARSFVLRLLFSAENHLLLTHPLVVGGSVPPPLYQVARDAAHLPAVVQKQLLSTFASFARIRCVSVPATRRLRGRGEAVRVGGADERCGR